MTQVTVDSQRFANGPRAQSRGTITCAPYAEVIVDGAIVTPASFTEAYPGAPVTLELEELPAGNGWKTRLEVDGLVIDRLVAPTGAGPVQWADLPNLDPSTMQPLPDATPAWEPYVATAIADKVDRDELTEGLETKADVDDVYTKDAANDAITEATATKTDKTANLSDLANGSAARENLAVADYAKLLPWYAALANRDNARVNIIMLGASSAEGFPVTAIDKNREQQLAKLLRATYPTQGPTPGQGGRGFIGIPTNAVYATGGWPQVYTGGTRDEGAFHVGAKHQCWYTNAASTKMVHTVPAGGITSFDICHTLGASGGTTAGYYKIDGGSAVTFSTLNATTTVGTLHVDSPVTSTIEVGHSGAGYLILTGITEYNGDENKGIQVHNCGHSGYTIAQWTTEPPATTVGDWADAIAALIPALIIIPDSGINDGDHSVSAADYKTALVAFIAKLRARVSATAPIVLEGTYDVTYGLGLAGAHLVDPWPDYVAAQREVAAADATVVFLDQTTRVPAAAASDPLGLYHTDKVHGNANGKLYALCAGITAEAIRFR